ncbi:ricin-type beta-trefoil lectin domain protein [Streptomyces sp. NPDC085639]|uniref:ricin-type beta-trefoil lectin domain protein n=1 Tax=Streptomyces sp. NPDC085639 TaxID=3365734 RepID=UPI0037D2B944
MGTPADEVKKGIQSMIFENLRSRWLQGAISLGTAVLAVALSVPTAAAEPAPEDEGNYFKFRAIQDDGLCLDAYHDNNEAPMQTSYWDCRTRNEAQEWAMTVDGRIARDPGRDGGLHFCLTRPESAPGTVSDGTITSTVCIGDGHPIAARQQWRRGPAGTVTTPDGIACLTRVGAPWEGPVFMSRCSTADPISIQWTIDSDLGNDHPDLYYGRVNGPAGLCLSYENEASALPLGPDNNARVWTQDCDKPHAAGNAPRQISVGADGTLRVWGHMAGSNGGASESGHCLTPARGETSEGTLVTIWECNNTKSQQWIRHSDGSLFNVAAELCLTSKPTSYVPNLSTAEVPHENRVTLEDCDGEPSQNWVLPELSRL